MATRAFDPRRPPGKELIEDCVHCGFCLPTCPTYVLWGEEMDSPRGRIVLMDEGLKDGSEMSAAMVAHFDRCLGCMACVTACPSGVRYDHLIAATRPQVERNGGRPRRERVLRSTLFALFTHPARMRALAPLLRAYRALGIDRTRAGRAALGRVPRVAALAELAPDVPVRSALRRLPARTRAAGRPRGRVALLQGCVQRVFFSDVNAVTVRVLAAEGYDVVAPAAPRCCGALMMHSGYEDGAMELARAAIVALEDCDHVVVNAAGCGSAMKDYGFLLADDPQWAERARAFTAKVRDVSELLCGEPVAPRGPIAAKVVYHDACHLAHAQGVREQPRALLRSIPGLEVVEPDEWEVCCGSAGVYNVLQPEAAAELGRRKAAHLLAAGADAVVAGNPGCTLQISRHLAAAGRPLSVLHPVELLDRSIRAGGPG